ncbi:MAG: acyl-CoA thioester hydrolase [Candidatus Eremiobacteraeota bacterium]|nr:acyl-CoA thioester hydrolase [Candidatus Eremiobacteraeota bacterium]
MPEARNAIRGRTHVTRTRVRFGETDAAGIVFYPTFFAWFDAGMTGLLRSTAGGNAMHDAHGRPRLPVPIVESGARFVTPLYYDDPIAIRSTIVELGTSTFRIEHVVLRGDDEVARGFEVRVLIGNDGGRIAAVALPPDLRAALADGSASEDEVA